MDIRFPTDDWLVGPPTLLGGLLAAKDPLAYIELLGGYFRGELGVIEGLSFIDIVLWSLHFSNIIMQTIVLSPF